MVTVAQLLDTSWKDLFKLSCERAAGHRLDGIVTNQRSPRKIAIDGLAIIQ